MNIRFACGWITMKKYFSTQMVEQLIHEDVVQADACVHLFAGLLNYIQERLNN